MKAGFDSTTKIWLIAENEAEEVLLAEFIRRARTFHEDAPKLHVIADRPVNTGLITDSLHKTNKVEITLEPSRMWFKMVQVKDPAEVVDADSAKTQTAT